MLVDQAAVVAQHRAGALDGRLGEVAARVHPFAQARDAREAQEIVDGARGLDVGQEQTRGVGPDVDDGDAHWARMVEEAGEVGRFGGVGRLAERVRRAWS